ncbi:hypothetical protein BD769DRAFT_1487501 [Suillus cothurnatus]|nr:hypothetical protein BD769DRAFT_1487501 [Suillus cothurnatus]
MSYRLAHRIVLMYLSISFVTRLCWHVLSSLDSSESTQRPTFPNCWAHTPYLEVHIFACLLSCLNRITGFCSVER